MSLAPCLDALMSSLSLLKSWKTAPRRFAHFVAVASCCFFSFLCCVEVCSCDGLVMYDHVEQVVRAEALGKPMLSEDFLDAAVTAGSWKDVDMDKHKLGGDDDADASKGKGKGQGKGKKKAAAKPKAASRKKARGAAPCCC